MTVPRQIRLNALLSLYLQSRMQRAQLPPQEAGGASLVNTILNLDFIIVFLHALAHQIDE